MGYYDLTFYQRIDLEKSIYNDLYTALSIQDSEILNKFFADKDTYIRKLVYKTIGSIFTDSKHLGNDVLKILEYLFSSPNELIRQTVINTYGEIAIHNPNLGFSLIEKGLPDNNSKVRNAVIGSLKKAGKYHPKELTALATKYLNHSSVEVRRQVIHGLELRGRTHPEDILSLLFLAQFDPKAKIRNMVIHVLTQISYKKGALEKVLVALKSWENQEIIQKALEEIMLKHHIDEHFTYYKAREAYGIICKYFPEFIFKFKSMNILNKLASAKGLKSEEVNIRLAEQLAKTMDRKAIKQIVDGLKSKNTTIQNDCIKVLYEIGKLKPNLISKYVDIFIELLKSSQNRLVWGGMTALATIAHLKIHSIWAKIEEILSAFENGSVITKDQGMKVISILSSKNLEYEKKLFPILLNTIETDRPKDVAKDVEYTSIAVNKENRESFINVITEKQKVLSRSQNQRISKILKTLNQSV